MGDYYNNQNMGAEIGWDDEIAEESSFVLLEPGDYPFTVTGFERKRFGGSVKMCACNMAELQIDVGATTVRDKLFLNKKTEWRLSQFFTAIGQKEKGVPFVPNWSAVPGSTGVCKVGMYTWKNDDGEEKKYNEIKEYYAPDNAPKTTQQTSASKPQGGWQPGKF